jgi:excisionase family DNA binding protein
MPSRRVKPPAKIEKKLLSRSEAGLMLGGVHDRTVDALVKRGKLKGVKLGRRHMITSKSVEELVAVK